MMLAKSSISGIQPESFMQKSPKIKSNRGPRAIILLWSKILDNREHLMIMPLSTKPIDQSNLPQKIRTERTFYYGQELIRSFSGWCFYYGAMEPFALDLSHQEFPVMFIHFH
uniref:Uncharacterized protein n=1 Tax=Romanomermis culicivorax TaxID=13658 RepID=A0A915KY49_ROMCU